MSGCLIAVIVVCCIFGFITILGIVATFAVPGLLKYTKESKKSEATVYLKMISDGAYEYYKSEHKAASGEVVRDAFPVATSPVLAGPEEKLVGLISSPIEVNFREGVWKDLNFIIDRPFYYTYSYVSDGKSFVAKAYASMSEECDSIFVVKGTDGEIGNILDVTDTHDCTPAKLK